MTLCLSFVATPNATAPSAGASSIVRQAPPNPCAATSPTIISVTPPNINSTDISPGSTVTFGVNMSLTPCISAFLITLQFDPSVMNASYTSLDYSTGLFAPFGSTVYAQYDCFNGRAVGDSGCTDLDGVGYVSLGLNLLGTQINDTSGLLFNVHLLVNPNTRGLSIVHIARAQVNLGGLISYKTKTVDGYFSNKSCGGPLCRPLQMSLNYSAIPALLIGRPIRFNATVTDPNPSSIIGVYQWQSWGTSDAPENTTKPFNTHTYLSPGEYTISLTVRDSYGILGQTSVSIVVGRVWIELTVDNPAINPQVQVVSGTNVNITATARNVSTLNETARVDIIISLGDLGNKTLKSQTFPNMPIGQASLSYTLDTTGLMPRAYRIFDRVDLTVTNTTLYQNRTADSSHVDFLQIIQSLTGVARLSLFQAGAIGIAAVVVVNVAYILLRRISKRSELDAEAL